MTKDQPKKIDVENIATREVFLWRYIFSLPLFFGNMQLNIKNLFRFSIQHDADESAAHQLVLRLKKIGTTEAKNGINVGNEFFGKLPSTSEGQKNIRWRGTTRSDGGQP